jgi:diguanylate cyclase (GGDEF)-like protein
MQQRKQERADAAAARRRRLRAGASLLLIVVLSALSAIGLARSQHGAQVALERRYATRAALAAATAQSFVTQLLASEAEAARRHLATGVGDFGAVVSAFGFTNAVLLNARGEVLAVYPKTPSVIGEPIAAHYPQLATAETGRPAVSPVVLSAADGQPVVSFAVPFDTPTGRRVFNGALPIRSTPLKAYLTTMASLSSSRLLLIDDKGLVLASTTSSPTAPVSRLEALEPKLAAAYRSGPSARYGNDFFVSEHVVGTPWTILATVPQDVLLAPVKGNGEYLAWAILVALVATAFLAWFLGVRRALDHDRLKDAYRRLDRLARVDGLTGTQNRRATGEQLAAAHASARAARECISVLMVDVDHFKRINDTYGHVAGDEAIIAVAGRMQRALRPFDVLGRWGGEEFLVILPDSDPDAALAVAERLREAVRTQPVSLGASGQAIEMTVSIGVATSLDALPDALVHAADQALYAAKADGRDRVRVLSPTALAR